MYLGNEGAVSIVQSYLERFGQKGAKKSVILTGPPGIGKTFMTKCIADVTNLQHDIFNASAKRTKKDVKEIYLHTQMNDGRIVVLDECEGMKAADLKMLINKTNVPLFLCCNFIDDIAWDVKDLCFTVKIERPPKYIFKQYISMLAEEEEIEIDENLLDELATKAKSFRHAQRLVDDPDDDGAADMVSVYDQVEMSLRGQKVEHFGLKPDELIFWINDNANDPDTISKANIMLERAYLKSYKYWKYAYMLLGCVRSNDKINFPRTFSMMSKAKKNAKEGKIDSKASIELIIDDNLLNEIELEDELSLDSEFNLDDDISFEIKEEEIIEQKNVDEWM